MSVANQRPVDHTNIHRLWRGFLIALALLIAVACYFIPLLLVALGIGLISLVVARLVYKGRERYIPNLYARDISVYDEQYRRFILGSLDRLRGCRISGHPLLQEATLLKEPDTLAATDDDLLIDLGVWIGWSTRLINDASGRPVYGFDTFSGLVEDWQIDDFTLVKSGTFSITDPHAQQYIRSTGVTITDGVPTALGRKVQFVKGSTYDTLAPFLASHPGRPIRLFHMDLDTYESCLHALETCKQRFTLGSILVFDEYLVTNGEMQAFYEFQNRYQLEWEYRTWGLEIMEMNAEMVTSRFQRYIFYIHQIMMNLLHGDGCYLWAAHKPRFWRFWLGATVGDIAFILGAAGQRKSVSLELTGLGKLSTNEPAP